MNSQAPTGLGTLRQNYDDYTPEDFEVWKVLFERQYALVGNVIAREYREAIKAIGFQAEEIPRISRIDEVLSATTGWKTIVVPGIIPDREFFQLLATRQFPATTWLRRKDQLDYLEEPDMFHDVFGHIPLLTDRHYTDFLEGLGELALEYIDNAEAIETITRIYWYTIEFGLKREEGKLRIFGAGIVSSMGESKYCMRSEQPPTKHDFSVQGMIDRPFRKDIFQDNYYVTSGYDQMFESLGELRSVLKAQYP
jgi:phenylalanine-4-hydroxylase